MSENYCPIKEDKFKAMIGALDSNELACMYPRIQQIRSYTKSIILVKIFTKSQYKNGFYRVGLILYKMRDVVENQTF